ncbi:hypothetical protein BGX27_002175, partial [Mortierella sp. AM989]
ATIATGNGDLTPLLTGIFSNAINGIATPLDAQGTGAPGVSWLDTAIKSLLLHTSLPPLAAEVIESVAINSMDMDFACDTCTWAPNAISSITAKTNLPFANGAPIVQLRQNIEILDKNGVVVGTLNTPWSPATASNNTVTTTTPMAPLVVADGSRDIYSAFIGDLNQATDYELGLRGTADSVLDLGALGKIEVKGIKLNVKSTLAGLQGLKKVDVLSAFSFKLGVDGFTISSIINIHNPSSLTLNLGSLRLKIGISADADGWGGYSDLLDLKLVPGVNNVQASVLLVGSSPAGNLIAASMFGGPVEVYLYGFDGTSQNPALNAGLGSLLTTTILDSKIFTTYSAPPYKDFKLKLLPSTVQDGIFEATATFSNPYFSQSISVDYIHKDLSDGEKPSQFRRSETEQGIFNFVDDFKYELAANSSKTLTFQMYMDPAIAKQPRAFVEGWVNKSKSGSISLFMSLTPRLRVGQNPTLVSVDWSSHLVYPETMDGLIPVQTGPDFGIFLEWYDAKNQPALLAPSSTTAAPTIAPSPTSPSTPVETVTATTDPVQTTDAPVTVPVSASPSDTPATSMPSPVAP